MLNSKIRDKWIATYRKKQLWKEKLYINEHLTKKNQTILYETKQNAKKKNFKFVWVRDCKILVRKNETSRIFTIRSLEDMESILHLKSSDLNDTASSTSYCTFQGDEEDEEEDDTK